MQLQCCVEVDRSFTEKVEFKCACTVYTHNDIQLSCAVKSHLLQAFTLSLSLGYGLCVLFAFEEYSYTDLSERLKASLYD